MIILRDFNLEARPGGTTVDTSDYIPDKLGVRAGGSSRSAVSREEIQEYLNASATGSVDIRSDIRQYMKEQKEVAAGIKSGDIQESINVITLQNRLTYKEPEKPKELSTEEKKKLLKEELARSAKATFERFEAEEKAKEEAERKAKKDAEDAEKRRLKAMADARAEADRLAKEEEERKIVATRAQMAAREEVAKKIKEPQGKASGVVEVVSVKTDRSEEEAWINGYKFIPGQIKKSRSKISPFIVLGGAVLMMLLVRR